MEARHQPQSARSCELALRTVEAARGPARGGGVSCLGVGRPWFGALPRPTARPSGVRPWFATHWLWVRGVLAWGPVTNPTARALASWLCALRGPHERDPEGGRLLPGYGASWVGRSPTPDRPSLGRAAGARYPVAVRVVCGCGAPSPTPQRPLLRAAFPRSGGGTRVPRGGGASLVWVWGVSGWALSHARPPVLRVCGRGPLPTGYGCGECGRGDPSPAQQRALLRSGFARCGAARGHAGGGGVSCLGAGRPCLSALPRMTARPWGVRPGPATHWLLVQGLWAWTSVANPTARSC